jgi:hypothetical protein
MSGVTEFELAVSLSVRSNLCPEETELETNLDSETQQGGEDCET